MLPTCYILPNFLREQIDQAPDKMVIDILICIAEPWIKQRIQNTYVLLILVQMFESKSNGPYLSHV